MTPLMPERPPHWLLKKYRDGQCTAAEAAIVDKWFDTEADQIDYPTEQQDIEEVQHYVLQMIRSSRKSRIRRLGRMAAAAAVACLLISSGTWYLLRSRSRQLPPEDMVIVQTNAGQQKKLTLPDGSSITLNSCSRIQFAQAFQTKREVYLQGEAFFDVKPGAAKAFRVVTDSLQVLVLGTRFNLASYSNSYTQQVTLESGKVAVYKAATDIHGGKGTVLHPGEMLQYSRQEIRVMPADMESTTAWQKGLLVYKDIPLSEICKDLERRYNVNIRINSQLTAATLYHYHSRQVPLTTVLKVLSETGRGFRFHSDQHNITIY